MNEMVKIAEEAFMDELEKMAMPNFGKMIRGANLARLTSKRSKLSKRAKDLLNKSKQSDDEIAELSKSLGLKAPVDPKNVGGKPYNKAAADAKAKKAADAKKRQQQNQQNQQNKNNQKGNQDNRKSWLANHMKGAGGYYAAGLGGATTMGLIKKDAPTVNKWG